MRLAYPLRDPSYRRMRGRAMSMEFNSRRSVVHSAKGMAASSQPLAAATAVKLLDQGCNAVEAAVGCSAALAVVEPGMTSLGDAFLMVYNAKKGKVEGLNGSGKSSRNINLEKVREKVGADVQTVPFTSGFSVNVPGAAAAWVDACERWGTGKSLELILAPAIELARGGFPVSKVMSSIWKSSESELQGTSLLVNGIKAPKEGELFVNEPLAVVLERIAKYGKDGFYAGPTADAIVAAVQERGGVLDHQDLANHATLTVEPVATSILDTDKKVWELPPNNHGIVALLALNIMREAINQHNLKLEHNSVEYIHLLTECLKAGFAEAEQWVADPHHHSLPDILLSSEHAAARAREFYDPKTVSDKAVPPLAHSDTSYYCVTDTEGNACSMISSLYHGFGSCIVPKNTGFALQNRGCNFSLDPASRNALGPSKRSYHTIIPAMLTTQKDELYAAFGVMGGFMQPQGHVQVSLNMLVFGMDPQAALDAPRVCLTPPDMLRGGLPIRDHRNVIVNLEEGIAPEVADELEHMGHHIKRIRGAGRSLFGRGQVIVENYQKGKRTYHAGSDPRGDGAGIPQV